MQVLQKDNRRGFTLVELLVSIAVIAILVGLFFPALNMVRQKAWNTAAKDMCSQTADAWNALLMDHRRFPSEDLIKDRAGSGNVKNVGKDVYFPMNTEATSLLNWWKPHHRMPEYDKANYQKYLDNYTNPKYGEDHPKRGDKVLRGGLSWDNMEDWPNDLYLERTPDQKKWGLIAPWAKRYVLNATDDSLEGEAADCVEAATLWVMLDMDGNGKVQLPDDLGKAPEALDADGKLLEIRKAAVAWVFADKDKRQLLTSW